jgi:hypothetical protein
MPDVMYLAGVRCEGCHLDQGHGETRTAGEVSCMSCHGPKYRSVYEGWQQTVGSRTAGLRGQFDSTTRSLRTTSSPVYADAKANLELVERGRGIHNVPFTLALLDTAHRQLNEVRSEQGLGEQRPPWPTAPYETECLGCHAGAEATSEGVFGRVFPHEPHVMGQGIECTECHTTHEERDTAGMGALKIGATDCNACHHAEATADTCVRCHGGVMKQTFAVDLGDFDHSMHVEDMGILCTSCHGEPSAVVQSPDIEVCVDCH